MRGGLPGLAVAIALAVQGTGGVAQGERERACNAGGAGNLSPVMTGGQACARFARALEEAISSQSRGDGRTSRAAIELSFSRNGVARAQVRHHTAAGGPFTVAVAISDKALGPAAIDRLASEVAIKLLSE